MTEEISDHDLLIRIDERVGSMVKFDERIDTLEDFKNYHTGALALLTGGILLLCTIAF